MILDTAACDSMPTLDIAAPSSDSSGMTCRCTVPSGKGRHPSPPTDRGAVAARSFIINMHQVLDYIQRANHQPDPGVVSWPILHTTTTFTAHHSFNH